MRPPLSESGPTVPRALPCHPAVRAAVARSARGWARCPECGTLLRAAGSARPAYDDDYPLERRHHDPAVGECKVRSLARWLDRLRIRAEEECVCEIGFGGGHCLAWLHRRGAQATGVDPIAANRRHAVELGVPSSRVFDSSPLPALPDRPTLWLFQDSFEHVEDPPELLRWMARASSPERARALVVAPDGGSWSRRLLGPLWLHHTPDHWIHYTPRGVETVFAREGFRVDRRFRPWKCLSLATAVAHARLLRGLPGGGRRENSLAPRFWFNLGEMGLLLERHAHRSETAG